MTTASQGLFPLPLPRKSYLRASPWKILRVNWDVPACKRHLMHIFAPTYLASKVSGWESAIMIWDDLNLRREHSTCCSGSSLVTRAAISRHLHLLLNGLNRYSSPVAAPKGMSVVSPRACGWMLHEEEFWFYNHTRDSFDSPLTASKYIPMVMKRCQMYVDTCERQDVGAIVCPRHPMILAKGTSKSQTEGTYRP